MRLHLDTSFLVDVQRRDPSVGRLLDEILNGTHEVSIDAVVEAEFFAAPVVTARKEATYRSLLAVGSAVALTSDAARLAASWLARMDQAQRRAHFADALIAATASIHSATLVTGDLSLRRTFPIAVLEY